MGDTTPANAVMSATVPIDETTDTTTLYRGLRDVADAIGGVIESAASGVWHTSGDTEVHPDWTPVVRTRRSWYLDTPYGPVRVKPTKGSMLRVTVTKD